MEASAEFPSREVGAPVGLLLVRVAQSAGLSYPVVDCCDVSAGLRDEDCFRWAGEIGKAFPEDPMRLIAAAYLEGHPEGLTESLASMGLATCTGEGFEAEWRETMRRLATACWMLREGLALIDSGECSGPAQLAEAENRAWNAAWRGARPPSVS